MRTKGYYPGANTSKISNIFKKSKICKVITAKKWTRVFAKEIVNLIVLANCSFNFSGLMFNSNVVSKVYRLRNFNNYDLHKMQNFTVARRKVFVTNTPAVWYGPGLGPSSLKHQKMLKLIKTHFNHIKIDFNTI